MSLRLNKRQKRILESLLHRIERRTDVTRRVSVRPEQIWKGYSDDFADVNAVEEFEVDVAFLEKAELISISRQAGRITRIIEVPGKSDDYYALTGIIAKQDRIEDELDIYRRYRSTCELCRSFCDIQISLLREGKKAEYSPDRGEKLCRLLVEIYKNREKNGELLERELSVRALGDSKEFEKHFRSAVCNIIAGISCQDKGKGREWEKSILEQYGIVANPSYIYIKGNISLRGEGDTLLRLLPGCSAAVSAGFLSCINKIQTSANTVMTVENLSAFHSVDDNERICVYTGGYHSVAVKDFLQKLNRDNNIAEWFHFGDIDPDGFYILKNLRKASGIDFKPYKMDEGTLIKYRESARALSESDRVKCRSLIEEEWCKPVISCMLENNIKLEQEIIEEIREIK